MWRTPQTTRVFCCAYEELLCGSCLVKVVHRGHEVCEAKDIIREELELLRATSLESAEKARLNATVGVTEVTDMAHALKKRGEEMNRRIQEQFQQIHELLRQREQVLIGTTDTIITKKVTRLKEQNQLLKKSKPELEQHVEAMKAILARRNDFSFLKNKKTLISNVSKSVVEALGKDREPVESTKDGPDLYLPDSLVKDASVYGEVFCQPYPPRFVASGDGLKKAFLDAETKFVIHAYDCFGQANFVSGTAIVVSIKGPDEKVATPFDVSEQSRGAYIVRYTPKFIGFHSLTITADAVPIHNSTAKIVVFKSKDYPTVGLPNSRRFPRWGASAHCLTTISSSPTHSVSA